MRTLLLVLLAPCLSLAQDDTKPSVMEAHCQCEVWVEGRIIDQRDPLEPMMGLMTNPTNVGFSYGEYKLDPVGKVTKFLNSTLDKDCMGTESGEMSAACYNAAWYAQQRAQGACAKEAATRYSTATETATGLLNGRCSYALDGEYLDVPEALKSWL